MKKQVTAPKEKSIEKRSIGTKECLEKSLRERKAEALELASDKNKKSAILQKNLFSKKDNLKKLSLAIMTYYDSSKAGERALYPSSTKNEDSKNKKLLTGKYSALLDGHKAVMTMPSAFDNSGRLQSSSLLKHEDKSTISQPRPGSISVTKAKKEAHQSRQDSYRFVSKDIGEDKQKLQLVREKTIPKLISAGDQSTKIPSHVASNSFILNSQNAKNFKGSSMFKACINSISRKIDRLPVKDAKPKKAEKSATLNSVTQVSSKAEESISRNFTGMTDTSGQRAGTHEQNLNSSFTRVQQVDHRHYLVSNSHLQVPGNKENELSRINTSSVSVSQSKVRDSMRVVDHALASRVPVEYLRDESSAKASGKVINPAKRTTINRLSKRKSGEYDFSSESGKFREMANSKIKQKIIEKSMEEANSKRLLKGNKLDIHKIHTRIKSSRVNQDEALHRDDMSDTVKVEQSQSSSRKTIPGVYPNHESDLLACEEREIRVPVIIDTRERQELGNKTSLTSQATSTLLPEEQNSVVDKDTLMQLLLSEQDYQFNPHYLDTTGTHIKWNMRAILLNWIVEVSDDFGLKRSTYHYAANYIDRYLAVTPDIPVKNLQLVGLTALDLATKLEEIFIPGLKDFALVALNNYTVKEIQKMELHVLKVIIC